MERLDVSAYAVPTDAPESDGTLAWDSTTVVLVEVSGGVGGREIRAGWRHRRDRAEERGFRTRKAIFGGLRRPRRYTYIAGLEQLRASSPGLPAGDG